MGSFQMDSSPTANCTLVHYSSETNNKNFTVGNYQVNGSGDMKKVQPPPKVLCSNPFILVMVSIHFCR